MGEKSILTTILGLRQPSSKSLSPSTEKEVTTTLHDSREVLSERTETTPDIYYDHKDHALSFIGRILPINSDDFWIPLHEKIKKLCEKNKLKTVIFQSDFFNTPASKHIMNIFKEDMIGLPNNQVTVHWHYGSGDEDILEQGQIYEREIGNLPYMKSWENIEDKEE